MSDPWLGNHMPHAMHGVAKKREKSKKEEKEGKKDEADYKRLQTFPLVRVRPGGGRHVASRAQAP